MEEPWAQGDLREPHFFFFYQLLLLLTTRTSRQWIILNEGRILAREGGDWRLWGTWEDKEGGRGRVMNARTTGQECALI